MIHWKLEEYLNAHNITAYALMKATGLAPATTYRLARGKNNQLKLETLDIIIKALEDMTGKKVSVCDLLEYEQERKVEHG